MGFWTPFIKDIVRWAGGGPGRSAEAQEAIEELAGLPPADVESEGSDGGQYTIADIERARDEAAFSAYVQVVAEFRAAERVAEDDRRRQDVISFCESGLRVGTIRKEWMERGLDRFMECLAQDVSTFQFSEFEAKESRLEWFKRFLSSVNRLVYNNR